MSQLLVSICYVSRNECCYCINIVSSNTSHKIVVMHLLVIATSIVCIYITLIVYTDNLFKGYNNRSVHHNSNVLNLSLPHIYMLKVYVTKCHNDIVQCIIMTLVWLLCNSAICCSGKNKNCHYGGLLYVSE